MTRVHIIGGGTVEYIRPHFAASAPAYGSVIFRIAEAVANAEDFDGTIEIHATKMAGDLHQTARIKDGEIVDPPEEEDIPESGLETSQDIHNLLKELVEEPASKIIFLPAAILDFVPIAVREIGSNDADEHAGWEKTGKDEPRLKTSSTSGKGEPTKLLVEFWEGEKIIRTVRQHRKDIFLVGFKETRGATLEEQRNAGLRLLKTASCNLVLANDTKTRMNMIVTPEQAVYSVTDDREEAINWLVRMALSRAKGSFTRSTVIDGEAVPWRSDMVPEALRKVVDFCVAEGAYKPFMGATVGHFAYKLDEKRFVTSMRRKNFNQLEKVGMVLVDAVDNEKVIAHGHKPSVGGQSQRIIFKEHPEMDCIVHFHCPLRNESVSVPVVEQWPHECGSHECGQNTSRGLRPIYLHEAKSMEAHGIKAVMLDNHGPNIVFHHDIDPDLVIDFIKQNFDLKRSTGEIDSGLS